MSIETILSCDDCGTTEGYRQAHATHCEKCLDELKQTAYDEGFAAGKKDGLEEAQSDV